MAAPPSDSDDDFETVVPLQQRLENADDLAHPGAEASIVSKRTKKRVNQQVIRVVDLFLECSRAGDFDKITPDTPQERIY